MNFQLFKWHFAINWYKFAKRWAHVFQIYPNAIHFNPPQFCPSLSLLSFPVLCLRSSIVLSRYFVISVNSMTTWSMLKLPKIAWTSPFKCIRELMTGNKVNCTQFAERNLDSIFTHRTCRWISHVVKVFTKSGKISLSGKTRCISTSA